MYNILYTSYSYSGTCTHTSKGLIAIIVQNCSASYHITYAYKIYKEKKYDLLKANNFLLSQYVIKLSLHSVLLFFSNEGDL